MAKVRGMDVLIKLASTAIDCWTSHSMEFSKEMMDATTYDSTENWNEYLPGFKSGTIPIEGKWEAGTSNYNVEELFSLFDGTSTAAFLIGATAAGSITYAGSCYVNGFRKTHDMGGTATWSATMQITGKVTQGTVSA